MEVPEWLADIRNTAVEEEFYLDEDRYPTENTITLIEYYPVYAGYGKYLERISKLLENSCGSWEMSPANFNDKGCDLRYRFTTGGWSGCEEIIYAMKKNMMFWMNCWYMSKRGGYYEFVIPRALIDANDELKKKINEEKQWKV